MWIKDFLDCLEASTFGQPRDAEALAIKEQHLPKRLYKYRRDYSNSRENLRTDTVWLSSPDSYNDPYDCSFKVAEDQVVAALSKHLVDHFVETYLRSKLRTQRTARSR